MKGINKVILLGHLGKKPEARYSAAGDCIVDFTLATNEEWKDKHTGEKKSLTEWHRCVAFRKLAEIIFQYADKGSKVYLEGRQKTRKWDDNGITKYITEVWVDDFQLLDRKESSGPPPIEEYPY